MLTDAGARRLRVATDSELGTTPVEELLIEVLVDQSADQVFVLLDPFSLFESLFAQLLRNELSVGEHAKFVIFAAQVLLYALLLGH